MSSARLVRESTLRPDRRLVFQGLGALGVAAALAGCGGGGSTGSGGGSGSAGPPQQGTTLTPASEVPVGGGVVLADQQLVVTQPTEGQFQAFTTVCTHQGGSITQVEGGDMVCALHGSRFAVDDGAPTEGPATQPLAEVPVTVEGGNVLTA